MNATSPDPKAVFINCPFDLSYEPLFVTLVGTLICLGQKPRCVLEVPEKGEGRLVRIHQLIERCRISIHDLSRVGTPARFNMPFELGLACSLKLTRPRMYEVFVMDAVEYRTDRTLSDYKGRDPLIHFGTCQGVVSALLDTFATDLPNARTTISNAVRTLRKSARVMKSSQKAANLFRSSLYRALVAAATEIAADRRLIET